MNSHRQSRWFNNSISVCENVGAIQQLARAHSQSLRGSQPAWLEEQLHVRNPDCHVFHRGGRDIGYCAVDQSKHLLLQFFVAEEFLRMSDDIFRKMLEGIGAERAYRSIRNSRYLAWI